MMTELVGAKERTSAISGARERRVFRRALSLQPAGLEV